MTAERPKRIFRQFTPEERARWEQARDETIALRPQLAEKGRRLREAARESTFSGALRTAIHQDKKPLDLIAASAGIPVEQLDEFLTGDRTLRNDTIDRLVQVLGFEFPPPLVCSPPKMLLPNESSPAGAIIDPTSIIPPQSTEAG